MQRWILVAVIAGLHLLAFAIGLFLRRRRRRRRAQR
ncbi:LPXTG cell wall anchor domain-containing protein [Sorangium sp. So ce233]